MPDLLRDLMPILELRLRNNVDYNPIPYSYVDPVTALPVVGSLLANQILVVQFLVPAGIYDFQAIVNGTPWPTVVDATGCGTYGPPVITTELICDFPCGDSPNGPYYQITVTHPGTPNDLEIFVQIDNGGIVQLCGGESTGWSSCRSDGDPCVLLAVPVNIDGITQQVIFDGEAECCGGPPGSAVDIDACPPGTLGDGSDLRVFLLARGGTAVLAELNPTEGYFTRKLDETSDLELKATVGGVLDQACCDDFAELYTWATEIAVYRDGRDAWVGPVTEIEFMYGQVSVKASDLTAWWDRRFLPSSVHVNTDLATIFADYVAQSMLVDPTPNLTVSTQPSGVLGDRTINGANYPYARDRLGELATSAVDWTAYGRTVLVGGQEIPATPAVTLLDEFFEVPPEIQILGNEQCNRVVVRGTGVTGIAQDFTYSDFYGVLERRFDEPDIKDQASADAAAAGRLEYLKDPTYVKTPSNSALKTTAAVTLPELIPGIRVRVEARSTCREVVRDFRLASVKCEFNGKVSVTLQPLGSVDAAAIANERD